jgi:hypothetical protein
MLSITLPLWAVFLPLLVATCVALFIIGDLVNDWVIEPWLARRAFPGIDRAEQLYQLRELRRRAREMGF